MSRNKNKKRNKTRNKIKMEKGSLGNPPITATQKFLNFLEEAKSVEGTKTMTDWIEKGAKYANQFYEKGFNVANWDITIEEFLLDLASVGKGTIEGAAEMLLL